MQHFAGLGFEAPPPLRAPNTGIGGPKGQGRMVGPGRGRDPAARADPRVGRDDVEAAGALLDPRGPRRPLDRQGGAGGWPAEGGGAPRGGC